LPKQKQNISLIFPVPSSFHACFSYLISRFNEKFFCRFIFFNTKSIYQYCDGADFFSLHSLTKNKIIFFLSSAGKKRDSNVLGNVHVIPIHLMVAPDVIVADVTIFIINDTSGLLKVNQRVKKQVSRRCSS